MQNAHRPRQRDISVVDRLAPVEGPGHVLVTLLLRLEALEKRIGDRPLFRAADAVVRAGDRIGIVGPNGAGKTTLLRVLIGEEAHDAGEVSCARGTRLGMLRQEIDPRASRSVRDEARTALAELDALEGELREIELAIAEGDHAESGPTSRLAARYDEMSTRFRMAGGFERHARVAEVLSGLGFAEGAMDRPLSSFSGGWLMRVELAKLLLAQPDILLLDEPTNHLDLPSIAFFEATLDRFPGAVLVVSHDRTFLARHTNRIFELDGLGGFQRYEGNYPAYLKQRADRRTELLARKANQDRQIAETERFVERFRAKATKAKQAQSRLKALERLERIEVEPERKSRIRLRIPDPPRSGERVLTLNDLHKRYGEEQIYSGVHFSVGRGEKVALVGPNGAGKSTLLRIAADALDIDQGERVLGHNVEFAFFAQHQLEALDPAATILEELARDATLDEIPRLRGHLGAFLFHGDDVEKRIEILSGGEKARVALAKLLLRPVNFLILDEPTNHLDIEACEVLEDAFQNYAGTLLFVSHDRAFINALATRVVEVEHGRLEDHLGDYDAYLERKARAASTLAKPGGGAPGETRPLSPGAPETGNAETPLSHKERRLVEREQRRAREKLARRIEQAETAIVEAEARQEALEHRLAEPEVYQDADLSRSVQAELGEAKREVEAAYAEWERLSEEAASTEG